MGQLELAIELATRFHEGQVDKCGEPYILHPLRVMMTVQGEQARVVAVLHDVLEDTEATAQGLVDSGIKPEYVKIAPVILLSSSLF